MPRFVSVADARALAKRRGFEPLQLTQAHSLLPMTVDLQQFGIAGRNQNEWFKKVRMSEAEWTAAFVRVRRHPLTKELCPEHYLEELYDTKPVGPFGDLIVRQYTVRLEKAAPRAEIHRAVVKNHEVIRLEHVLMHASFDNPQSRQGYDGYRIKTTRESKEDLVLTWPMLVDLAVVWLRDEAIVEQYPWAADPDGLTSEDLSTLAAREVSIAPPKKAADPGLTADQRVVHFGQGFLNAIRVFLDDPATRIFVQTVVPAAEHLVSECLKSGGELPTMPDPSFLIEEHGRLRSEAVRLASEAERLVLEKARLDEQSAALTTQRTELEQLRTSAAELIKRLFADAEQQLIHFRAKVHAEANALDTEKERLLALLS